MSAAIERILVAGASGATGREVLQELRGANFTVRAMTTSPETVDSLTELGADEVVVGDLLEPDDARRAVEGVDAVCCTVGTRPSLRALYGPLVCGRGVHNLIGASREAGVGRFAYESAIGVGNSRQSMPRWARVLTYRPLRAKGRSEDLLRRSGLTYTIIRPGWLRNEPPTGDVVVGEGGTIPTGPIPRADVARLMVASLFTADAENRTFEVVSRAAFDERPPGMVEVDWQYSEPAVVA